MVKWAGPVGESSSVPRVYILHPVLGLGEQQFGMAYAIATGWVN